MPDCRVYGLASGLLSLAQGTVLASRIAECELAMTEQTEAPKKGWEKWAARIWYARGVSTAVILLGLVEGFTDIGRFEFLRFFHAIAFGWNQISAKIGLLFEFIPFFPDMTALRTNMILLVGIGYVPLGLHAAETGQPSSAATIVLTLSIMVGSLFWMTIFPSHFYSAQVMILGETIQTSVFVLGSGFFVCFLAAMYAMPRYKGGILHTLLFMLTMQILYFLNLPILGNVLRNFSDSILGPL